MRGLPHALFDRKICCHQFVMSEMACQDNELIFGVNRNDRA